MEVEEDVRGWVGGLEEVEQRGGELEELECLLGVGGGEGDVGCGLGRHGCEGAAVGLGKLAR